ncbi:UDP-glycosyltransferase 83A1 [Iris pallida]|uniref:UDP-glycosyltransferase 83A1 n=1 Tax=Iris pallida TaxID=29817 RepID=A0AAX6FGR2_IRIPA|nr:UDP-glycosyltransferase 83A1 [Iris pallida]
MPLRFFVRKSFFFRVESFGMLSIVASVPALAGQKAPNLTPIFSATSKDHAMLASAMKQVILFSLSLLVSSISVSKNPGMNFNMASIWRTKSLRSSPGPSPSGIVTR